MSNRALLTNFLQENHEIRYCAKCLSKKVELTRGAVFAVLRHLNSRERVGESDFVVERGNCDACGEFRVTIGLQHVLASSAKLEASPGKRVA